jgi:predicted anti-sigma-YlaC factor YlaD
MTTATPDQPDRIEALAVLTEKHTHTTATWMKFIGVVVLVQIVLALIFGIVIAVGINKAATVSNPSQSPTTSSSCASQGGVDPSC